MYGVMAGTAVESSLTLVLAVTLSLTEEWRTALAIITFIPLSVLGSILQSKVHMKAGDLQQVHRNKVSKVSDVYSGVTELVWSGLVCVLFASRCADWYACFLPVHFILESWSAWLFVSLFACLFVLFCFCFFS